MTREFWGSGGRALREIIVSQDVRQAILAARLKGASFWPVTDA